MKKAAKYLTIIFRGIMTIAIIMLAMYVPGMLFQYADEKISGQTDEFQVEVKTYVNRYEGFNEILEKMAQTEAWDGVSLVSIRDQPDLISDDQLTEVVNQELECFRSYNNLSQEPKVTSDQLKERQLLSVYASDGDNPLNGIQLWKLVFENDTYRVNLVMEADFQKICVVQVNSLESPQTIEYKSSVSEDGFTVVEDADKSWEAKGAANYFNDLASGSEIVISVLTNAMFEKIQRGVDQKEFSISSMTGYGTESVLCVYYEEQLARDRYDYSFGLGIWQIYQMIQF